MSSKWREKLLGDFIELKRGYDLPKKMRSAGSTPLVSSAGVSDSHSEAKVSGPGVVTGRYGTIGEVFYIEEDFWPLNTTLYVKDFKGNDPRFTYYFLKTIDYRQYSDKAAVPGINRNHLHTAKVFVPESVEEQKRIASTLSAFDDKIRLNQQINQTLEKVAQAIFKSWFVEFDPVKAKIAVLESGGSEEEALFSAMQAISGRTTNELTRLQAEQPEHYDNLRATAELFPSAMQQSELGEIPEGWEVGTLSKLIQFNPRRSLKKGVSAPYLDMKNVPTSGHLAEEVVYREMKSGTKFINGDTLLARITPCLENGKTAYVDFLVNEQVGWGSTEYIVMRSQEPYPEAISYFIARDKCFRQHAIQSMTGTSGRQRANAKALADLCWVIYPSVIVEAFDQVATPYLELARCHGNESMSLSALRDSLLPKLLSGELSPHESKVQLEGLKEVAHV